MASEIKVDKLLNGSGGSFDGSQLANVGKVLQVVTKKLGYGLATTSTSEIALTEWSTTITKKQSTSTIIGIVAWYGYYSSSPTYWGLKAYANGVGVTSCASSATGYLNNAIKSHNQTQYAFGGGAHQHEMAQFYDNTNASTVTYTYGWQQNAAGSYNFWGSAPVTIIYMEIGA